MKKHALRSVAAMVLVVLLMSSCSKNALDLDLQQTDFKKRDFKRGDVSFQHADYVFGGCRIQQTIQRPSGYASAIYRQFEYDKDNNPVRVTTERPGTSQPNLHFKYDKKGNLIEYAGLYSGGDAFEFLHRYGYSNNRIVVDTMYVFGAYPNTSWYYSKRLIYLKYDALDRVVSDSQVYVYPVYEYQFPTTEVINYKYDGNGNLVRYGASYDDKVSPHRTNKIWMFIDRNYSVNNMVAANSYNSTGLPLNLSGDPYIPLMTFGYFYYHTSTDIVYDCIDHGKKFHPLSSSSN